MGIGFPIVDIFNSTSGTWSTATLSEARQNLAATSVGDLALFGGGQNSTSYYATVDLFYPSIPLVTPITEDITATFSNTSLQANLTLSSGQGVQISSPTLNLSSVTSQNNGTTYTYHSQSLEESFSFSPLTAVINWSIQSNASSLLGLNLSYVLALPNGSSLPSVPFFANKTSNCTTTYYIPLEGDLYALLVVPYALASLQVSSSGTVLLLQFRKASRSRG
jgi:hypothetical protein